ncbi:MAG: hypothetical protein IJ741_01285 [Schwartzia sp.]|nr:hypothetical protein [Schwartzia sp. (in: firmicutes)]
MTPEKHRGIDMNDAKRKDSTVAADGQKQNEQDELNAQIKRDQEYLSKVFIEEKIKRQEISDNLKKFHEVVDEREESIKEGMKKEYLTDSKMMLDKINSFKENLKNNK